MYNIGVGIRQSIYHLVDKIVIVVYFSLRNVLQDFDLLLFDHMVYNFLILQNHYIYLDKDS